MLVSSSCAICGAPAESLVGMSHDTGGLSLPSVWPQSGSTKRAGNPSSDLGKEPRANVLSPQDLHLLTRGSNMRINPTQDLRLGPPGRFFFTGP